MHEQSADLKITGPCYMYFVWAYLRRMGMGPGFFRPTHRWKMLPWLIAAEGLSIVYNLFCIDVILLGLFLPVIILAWA